jgi:hypothetical protein
MKRTIVAAIACAGALCAAATARVVAVPNSSRDSANPLLNAFSPSCIQSIVAERKPWTYEFMTHGEISEDCLYLNVWTPATSTAARRPVFVYIYGGNVEGSGAVAVYDGEGLASKGLVVDRRLRISGPTRCPVRTSSSTARFIIGAV